MVVRCPRCGWSAAASFVEPWMEDDAPYELYVRVTAPTNRTLVELARISGSGALEVRRALRAGRFLVATGYHDEVRRLREALEGRVDVEVELRRAADA